MPSPFGLCEVADPGFKILIIHLAQPAPYGWEEVYDRCADGSIFLQDNGSQYTCEGFMWGDDLSELPDVWSLVFEVPAEANSFTLSLPGWPLIDVPPAP